MLHALVAVLVLSLFALGLYMADLPLSPQKLKLYSYHKWAGVTVFLLALARVLWRIGHQPPAFAPSLSAFQQRAAGAGHALLYVLMVIVPLSGWLMSSAKGFQTVWFGVLPLPDLLAMDKVLGDTLLVLHQYLNYAFMAVVAGHVAMALKHHFIDGDGSLRRMFYFR